ncbi:MAG: DEAD/DEAH box helicase family protein, partial [Bacteroidota bacterium]
HTPSEIKAHLKATTHHNELFWHFRIDVSKPIKQAFQRLKDAFIASSKTKKEAAPIQTTGKHIGNQLLENTNSPFVSSLIGGSQFTSLVAPTGVGKSYFVEHHLVHFIAQIMGLKVILCSPRNALTLQQAIQSKGIVFTKKTNEKAIERLRKEIDSTSMVYSNYDNLNTAYEVLTELHQKGVFIVIDESHRITADSSFRPKAIASVCSVLEKNPSNLFLTATPTEIKLSKPLNYFEVLNDGKKPYERPTLLFTTKNKKLDATLENIQKAVQKGKRVMVHYNDLDSCKALKKELWKNNITARICASEGLDTEDIEFFEEIQAHSSYEWKNSVQVIITTSVMEMGVNLITDRKTSLIYVNCSPYGFDNHSYSQFTARIRNYTDFEVDNTIISQNSKSFLPDERLASPFNFETQALDFAREQVKLLNKQLRKLQRVGRVEKDRFTAKSFENVLYNEDKECF